MQKYTCNEEYFKQIDCEEKAYFLGILLADGQNKVRSDNGKKVLRWALAMEDEYILEKFLECIQSNNQVNYTKNKKYPNNLYPEIRIQNANMIRELEKYNFYPKKSLILEYPAGIPINLLKHFIRGFIDGDGCINPVVSSSGNYKEYSVRVYSTKYFLDKMRDEIFHSIGIEFRIYKDNTCRNNISCVAKIAGNLKVLKFLEWLYVDSTIFLHRKYNNYIELKKQQLKYKKMIY